MVKAVPVRLGGTGCTCSDLKQTVVTANDASLCWQAATCILNQSRPLIFNLFLINKQFNTNLEGRRGRKMGTFPPHQNENSDLLQFALNPSLPSMVPHCSFLFPPGHLLEHFNNHQ